MTFKNFWKDLWYGRWEVSKRFSHYNKPSINFGLANIKAEGSEVEYDPGAVYLYGVYCRRTHEARACESRYHAKWVCAVLNDMRGQ